MPLPQRRLLQNSVLDLLLAMAAVTALIVTYQSLAPRAFIYTASFLGGLCGAAFALSRKQPRACEVICVGILFGVSASWIGALVIEALRHRMLFESPWIWEQSPRGRTPATRYATVIGAVGGAFASGLYATLLLLNARLGASAISTTDDQSLEPMAPPSDSHIVS